MGIGVARRALDELRAIVDEAASAVRIRATCRTDGKTGVEMEALTAVSVAALTVYDMIKAVQKDAVIDSIRLLEKTGDASGGAVLTISYEAVAHLGHERALSAMTGAVLRAVRAGRPFHFRLHGIEMRHVMPPAAGKVLDALALA